MTVAQWLDQAKPRLREAGIESPTLEAQLLAAHVLLVQLFGQLERLGRQRLIAGKQQPHGDVGRAHASGRVHPRSKAEADVVPVDATPGQPGRFNQRPEPHFVGAAAQQVESDLGDDPVLADERNDVGQRAERGDLDEAGLVLTGEI